MPLIQQLYGEKVKKVLDKEEGSYLMDFIKTRSGWDMRGGIIIQYGFYLAAPED